MSYCINPRCHQRQNPDEVEVCQACGTSLLIDGRFRLIEPLRPLYQSHYTEIFEVVDKQGTFLSEPGTHKVMKVLKSLDFKLIELMQREARVLQLLGFPGIPQVDLDDYFVFCPWEGKEIHCLVMEKIEGQNLEQWVEGHGRITQSKALDWLEQLVHLLDHVHQSGFFHRDIKPSNILVQPEGQLALIDFNGVRQVTNTYLAKIKGEDSSTRLGEDCEITVITTPYYTPWEQINGQALPQSDFYALGRTFIYLLTGIPLVGLPCDPQTGKLIWKKKALQIDKPLADLIDELTDPVPGKRPKNTQEILYYLVKRLPRRLKRNQMLRSNSFKIGFTVFMLLFIFGSYKGGSWIASRVSSWYYYGLASENLILNHPEAAKKNFKRAIQSNPTDVDAYVSLGATCTKLEDYHCAIFNYKKALRMNPNSWQAYFGLAKTYDDLGNYAMAEKYYRRAMKINSNLAVDAINNLSRLKNRTENYQAAADLAQEGLQKTDDPMSEAALLKNLGWARLGQNRLAEAEKYLQKSLKLNPDRAGAYCLLAQVQEAQNDRDRANQYWRQCLTKDSDLPEVKQWRKQFLDRSLRN